MRREDAKEKRAKAAKRAERRLVKRAKLVGLLPTGPVKMADHGPSPCVCRSGIVYCPVHGVRKPA